MDVSGKVAIVTGASRGIGRQIAFELARHGAKIVAVARDADPSRARLGSLNETVKAIEEIGGYAIGVQANIAEVDDLQRLVAKAVEAFGRIDVLVNNAADMQGSTKPIQSYPRETWIRQFDINVHAAFSLISLVVPHMIEQGGGIILNITSGSADLVDRDLASSAGSAPDLGPLGARIGYVATKAALNGLTNAAAAEVAQYNIAVVAIDPGPTRTELADLVRERGFALPANMHAMEIPVAKVMEVITSANPLAYAGTIVRAVPKPPST
jgi:NAD(P)-dependent dehydrogenase (short-subunit alcohol dehydrogenase family)